MPIYKVTVTRETTDEVEVFVEAPSSEVLQSLTADDVYEAVNETREIQAWNVVDNDVYYDVESIDSPDGNPEFLVAKKEGEWWMDLAPEPPEPPFVDPKQLKMFPKQEDIK